MKLMTMTQVTVDGVMQGNGGASDEDRRNGFERGGWAMGVADNETTCAEGVELLGDGLTTVAVKRGLGAHSARMVPAVRARQLIEEGAKKALSDPTAVAPYRPGSPCEIRVEFKNTDEPDKLRFRPGVERADDRTIVARADTWWEAWQRFYF